MSAHQPGYEVTAVSASGAYPSAPSGYPPQGYPPTNDPHYGYGAYQAAAAYGQSPYGYGAPPPGYGASGYPPQAYGTQPPGRPPSPRRERERSPRRRDARRGGADARGARGGRDSGRDSRREQPAANDRGVHVGERVGAASQAPARVREADRSRADSKPKPPPADSTDPRVRCQYQLHQNDHWTAMWLEGVDPPRRSASASNVTMLLIGNPKLQTGGAGADHGFLMAHSRLGSRSRDRQRECCIQMSLAFGFLDVSDSKAWNQLPDPSTAKRQLDPGDVEKLAALVREQCPKVSVELPEPMACVVVGTAGFPAIERPHANPPEADLTVLDRYDDGVGELMQEARRVNGIVSKQWFLAAVQVRKEGAIAPFVLGHGLATDRESARARAVHAAEVRAGLLTEALLSRLLGEKPQDLAEAVPACAPADAQAGTGVQK